MRHPVKFVSVVKTDDSGAAVSSIHRRSAPQKLTDAPLRTARRPIGLDQGPVSGRPGPVGVTAADNRLFVEAVLYRYRAGIPWQGLLERFGDGKNVHRRFSRWAKSGVWKRVFQHLAADADNEYAMIDSTIVRAHQHSAGAQKKPATTRRPGVRAAD